MIRASLISVLVAIPATAQDRDTFTLPTGCTAYVTIQSRGCTVGHHFRCEADPAGHQQRVSFDEQGLTYLGVVDAETQWVSSFFSQGGITEQLLPNPADPASFSELIATGRDDYDFETLSDTHGRTRFKGTDTLTGRQVTIDGVSLSETAYEIVATTPDGMFLWENRGNEFINRDWRMFISGTGMTTTRTDSFETDETPVEFIFPGEPGFLTTRPRHGCGLMLSAAPRYVGDHT